MPFTPSTNEMGHTEPDQARFVGICHGWIITSAESTDPKYGVAHRAARWMLINRRTGRVTVAQWPNVPLSVFIILTVGLHAFNPKGETESVLRVLADVALLVWAVDELVRGVNPFRRILGLAVIGATIASLTL
jgi:hypothetical protein